MTIQLNYRSDSQVPLTSAQVDANFRRIADALAEATGGGATLVDVRFENRKMTFLMSDGTDIGPFDLAQQSSSGGITHAPSDGGWYASRNGGWASFAPGIAHAPADGTPYVSQDGGWVALSIDGTGAGIQHAPADGQNYVSKNGGWSVLVGGADGVEEAPEDGKIRGRKDGGWVEIPTSGSGALGPTLSWKGDWGAGTEYHPRDVVRQRGALWMSSPDLGVNSTTPSLDDAGWIMLGVPTGSSVTEASTNRFYHARPDGSVALLRNLLNNVLSRLTALDGQTF